MSDYTKAQTELIKDLRIFADILSFDSNDLLYAKYKIDDSLLDDIRSDMFTLLRIYFILYKSFHGEEYVDLEKEKMKNAMN